MSQPLIVFWSWQSDHPAKIAKNFVKAAFHEAIKINNDNTNVSFDSRPEHIELDHDTKGLLGPVDILEEIKKKIDACDHYLADITPVGRTDSGKALPNPNVMIELGYALKTKTIDQITFVANARYFKGVKDLPFDISKRRAPLCYDLGMNSKETKIATETTRFARTLLPAIQGLKPLIEQKSSMLANALLPHDNYTFLRPDSREVFGYTKNRERRFQVPRQPFSFLKIAPSQQIRPLMNKELNPDAKGMSMFVGIGNGGDWVREHDGWILIETNQIKPKTAVSISKTFMKTGLIWNVDYSNGRDNDNVQYLGDLLDHNLFEENRGTYIDLTFIPEHWFLYIKKALEAYKHLGIDGPYDIQAGMFVRMPLDVNFNSGAMYKMTGSSDRVLNQLTLSTDREIVDVVGEMFEAILDAAAIEHSLPESFIARAVGVKYE